jgi:hypothetical protein
MGRLIRYANMKLILIASLSIILGFSISCFKLPEKCGDGNYYCRRMINIQPYEKPIKYLQPFFDERILLSDGRLIGNKRIYNPEQSIYADSFAIYDLKSICQSDTICDIYFPEFEHVYRDTVISILTKTRLCRVSDYSTIVQEIGNNGLDSSRLISAAYMALDSLGNYYIIDSGDSTIKVFQSDGAFLMRFKAGVNPYRLIYYHTSNSLYVLDETNDSIREFTVTGERTSNVLNSNYFSNITAFNIFHGALLIADKEGKRLTAASLNGTIIESKTDFCYQDLSFNFGKIASIDLDSFGGVVNITDHYCPNVS